MSVPRKIKANTPQIEESLANIYALWNVASRGALLWGELDSAERCLFCRIAKLKTSNANKPLCQFSKEERYHLLSSIKSIAKSASKFARISSIEEFK